ncbi:hypothetical protein [Methylotenera sp.]|uniref:hypothetical protein n=1 Tax=Methylotenera sp. TaxID=2051956 RepID=UPI002ED77D08
MHKKTLSNTFPPQYKFRTFIISFISLITVMFSGVAYSETKNASKKPVAAAAKEMPALTENYRTELLVSFYDSVKSSLKDNEAIGNLSDESKELLYNCFAKRLNDTLWDSPKFKESRSFEAVNSQEVMKSNYEYCHLLATAKDTLAQPTPQSTKVASLAFNDLYVDYNNMVGKKVQVSGQFLPYGDLGMLSQSEISTTVIYVDNKQLSREGRKLLLDRCSSGCKVVFEGIVGDVQFQKGITATDLISLETKYGTSTLRR